MPSFESSSKQMLKQWVADHFYIVQILIGLSFLALWALRRLNIESQSQFKVREADLQSKNRSSKNKNDLGNATMKSKNPVFQLTGIRIDGKPHEILGISATASEEEIQKAYRDLIKRYHPDKVGPQGSAEWSDAQTLADALTQARNQMIQKFKK